MIFGWGPYITPVLFGDHHPVTVSIIHINPALRRAALGTVTIQAKIILRNNFHSTLALERTYPMATMEPTLQCVVLTGIPRLDARSTVVAAPSSIVKPLWKNESTA